MFRAAALRASKASSQPVLVAAARTRPAVCTQRMCFARHESLQAGELMSDAELAAKRKEADKIRRKLQEDWDAPKISYEEMKKKSESPSFDTFIIDVREPNELLAGTIPSAVNLPLSGLPNSLKLAPDTFRERHGFDKPRSDQEIVFFCRSGMRSSSASDIAKRNGYTNILNYKGSWLDWIKNEQKTH